MATAMMNENLLSMKHDLKTMTELVNEIIEGRRSEAIQKDITGRVRFAVEQSDGRCIQINGITFRTEISITDGSTGTCDVIQHGQTVFRAGYDKYNEEIEKIEMYIPGSWEAVLDELTTESWRIHSDAAERAIYDMANAWHINTNPLIKVETGGSR